MNNDIDTIKLDIIPEELNCNKEIPCLDFELADTILIPNSEDFN